MLKRKHFFILLLSGFALFSCQEKFNEDSFVEDVQQMHSKKILHTKADASGNSLLVKFDQVPTESLISELSSQGVVSISKVFPSVSGKEELERRIGLDRWYEVEFAQGDDLEDAALRLAAYSEVTTVEYNVNMTLETDGKTFPYTRSDAAKSAEAPFNDPHLPVQWNYNNTGDKSIALDAVEGADINVLEVWKQLTCGDPSIIVAVIDEGVDVTHPDLVANMWKNEAELAGLPGVDDDGNGYIDDIYGYNFIANKGEIVCTNEYDTGHGTHCAGTIAAVNNNGVGVSGVAGGSGKGDGCRIMTCQIFANGRGGDAYSISRAIKYAADNGASIISCSFGYRGGTYLSDGAYKAENAIEVDAIEYFKSTKNNTAVNGGIAIFASGNDGLPYATYPGAISDIISVSAFAPDYLPTYYTNYGPGCNIVAPGGEDCILPFNNYNALVLSTVPLTIDPSGYGYKMGTSMACPHVSGIAALGLSYAKKIGKNFELKKFEEMLVSSANDIDSRLNGQKTYYQNPQNPRPPLELGKYMKKLGTGSIDAWILMMKIEGMPCLTAEIGREQWLDVSEYFGTSAVNLTYLGVEVSDEDREALGLAADPYMRYGRLYIHPTKRGSGKIKIKAVGGGTEIGGEDNIGGMEVTQEVGIITRSFKSSNGGWL